MAGDHHQLADALEAVVDRGVHLQNAPAIGRDRPRQADHLQPRAGGLGPAPMHEGAAVDAVEGRRLQVLGPPEQVDGVLGQPGISGLQRQGGLGGDGLGQTLALPREMGPVGQPVLQQEEDQRQGQAGDGGGQ